MRSVLTGLVVIGGLLSANVSAEKVTACDTDVCVEYFTQYKAAAARGHGEAMNLLGQLYQAGYGTEKDVNKALHYYKKSAKTGVIAAFYKAGLLYLSEPSIRDLNKGIRYLETAARKNFKNANFLLGLVYLNKDFGLYDLQKADAYLAKAYQDRHLDMPVLVEMIKDKQEISAANFPNLTSELEATPLANDEQGNMVWPDDEMEVITITAPKVEEYLVQQLPLFRRPAKSLGSRLPSAKCNNQFSCYTKFGMEGLYDFPFLIIN